MVLWSSDVGYNFLVAFFIFWTLQILIGVMLKMKNFGINRKNYRHRIHDLMHDYINRLEEPYHRKH